MININVDMWLVFVYFLFVFKLEDLKASLAENDLIPLNEYRRNKLISFSEMPRNQRDRFDDSLEESRLVI